MTYTQRIAAGDFSPIVPARRFKDEFSELAVAVNRMLARLKAHEARLTRSSRMAAVGTLTAGIAHELNNPLNNIGLTVEALLDGFDDYEKADKLKMLEDVRTQLDRASATVRNLLDFTRVDSPVFVPVSLAEVAAESARLVSNEARISGVQIDLQLSPDLCPARGNPRDLQQVFLNLFLNAIQAMPNGGTLTVTGAVSDDEFLRIDVTDTGVGIPEENLSLIFDPFFTTKEVGKGTGLGLSVSYGIVQKHHGKLEVHSRVGVGTTFTLWIPCANAPPGADAANAGLAAQTR
jgi:two-component system NtrC family sensor kinase